MSLKLTDLIEQAALGGDSDFQEEAHYEKVAAAAPTIALTDFEDIEKLASVLEYLGRRGVGTLLEKTAMHGSSHPALKSCSSAVAFTKKEKAKLTSPDIQKVLAHKPFADGTLKQLLSSPAKSVDKNIHSKSAHDLNAIRVELTRRAMQGRSQ